MNINPKYSILLFNAQLNAILPLWEKMIKFRLHLSVFVCGELAEGHQDSCSIFPTEDSTVQKNAERKKCRDIGRREMIGTAALWRGPSRMGASSESKWSQTLTNEARPN